jgi:hypothetical protein
MHRFLIRTLLLTMLMLSFSLSDMAQGETPPDDPGNDPALPIDGGLSLLMAAGAAYGGRMLYRRRLKKRT